jgi:hypothetical protein
MQKFFRMDQWEEAKVVHVRPLATGEYFRVYKKIDGALRKIYEHPETTGFYHVVVGARLAGVPVFIGGCRRGKQQLFYVRASQADPLILQAEPVESAVGPNNVNVLNDATRDIIVAANRQPPTANRQPPTANRQPPTANRQPPTTNHQPRNRPGRALHRQILNAANSRNCATPPPGRKK